MNLSNILVNITTYSGFGSVKMNWLVKVIKAIIETKFYNVAIGIVIFTLLLKLITLPFDIYSRASTKKNGYPPPKQPCHSAGRNAACG